MKQVKQFLAFVLVVCMVCSLLPTAFAAPARAKAAANVSIDFTDPADAEKFTIDNKTDSEIQEGEGLYMISTNEAIEDCKGQLSSDAANTPRDVVQVAVEGDWTATLYLKVDTSGSSGGYEFLCLYGMADYENGCGIRAGKSSTVNFKEVNNVSESSTTGMKVSTGLSSGEYHWYRLEKAGTSYTGYMSDDGTEFQKVFTYENTGIEAKMIVIDAYSGMNTGYKYWLQSLTVEYAGGAACDHDYQPVVTPPSCTEGGYTTYTCSKCGDSYAGDETAPLGHDYKNGVCTRCSAKDPDYEAPAGVTIDFTDPADAEKFIVDNQTSSEIREGEGFYMISTNESFEDCKGQLSGDAAKTPRDAVQVPVSGDWIATLYLKVDTSGSQGRYEFICLYGMADYDNGCGIRAGNGSTVNYKEVDGVNESSTTGMKVQTGLTSGEYHWYRLEKTGTSYTGYLSEDGTAFEKVFTYENTGIEAKMIVIDAYSGMDTGYQYWLQSLTIEGLEPCEHDYQPTVTEPTCTAGGYTTYTCSKCGLSYKDNETPALGHDYKNGVCTRCGAKDPDYEAPVPTIDGITLDGEPMEGFEPKTFDYELNADDYETAPVVGYIGGGSTSSTLLITGSDFQDPATSYTGSDYAQNGNYAPQQARMKTIIGKIQESFGTASYFIGGGDYNFDEIKNSVSRTNTGIAKVKEAVQQACGEDVITTFVQGNHDAPGSDYSPTGPCDKEAFGLFTITEEDYRSYPQDSSKWSDTNRSEAKAQAVADALEAYLAEKAAAGFDKPVFVACHVPIHYNTRTKSKADAIYGDVIYKALHKYGDDLNIIFLYGHNHAWGDDDYLGGAANFLTRGDTINIAKHGSKDQFTAEPLNFTYMNYGYTGYYWAKWVQSSNQIVYNDVDSTLTMTAFQISGNQVIVSRWDENGMHDLKSIGVATRGERGVAEVCEPDTRVVESPDTVAAPKNPTGGAGGLEITVKQFDGIPGTATITCVDPATEASSVYTLTLKKTSVPEFKTALEAAIAEADKLAEADYTADSWAPFAAALAAAKTALTEAITQEAIDAAKDALIEAQGKLVKKETPPEVDKTKLEAAIAAAETLKEEDYTAESWAAFAEALAVAKATDAKADATQEQVDLAEEALSADMSALEKKPDEKFEFDDVRDPSKFYYEPVYWAVNHEPQVTNGATPTTFNPDGACTRGHVVTFLWRAAGEPAPTSSNNPFTDLKDGAFYYTAVLWAVEKGITTGASKTTFAPGKPCTRGQIVTFLWRFKNSPEPTTTENPFGDVSEEAFYYKAVLWAVENNVTSGTGKGKFSPNNTCTRGQVVTFLYRASGE